MNKPLTMGLLGLALVGGYFLLARRASAAAAPGAAAAPSPQNGASGATGALTSPPAQFSDGYFAPIPFEGGAVPGLRGPIDKQSPTTTTAQPSAPAAAPTSSAAPISSRSPGGLTPGGPRRRLY